MQFTPQNLEDFFLLRRNEYISIVLIALGVLVIVNINLVFSTVFSGSLLASTAVQESFAEQIAAWFENVPILNTITLVVFWIGIGLIAYSVIFAIYSLANEAHNEVVVEEEYINVGDQKSRLHGPAIQIGIVAGILILGILTLRLLFPAYNELFVDFVLGVKTDLAYSILKGLLAVFFAVLNIYCFKLLINWALRLE